MSLSPPLRTPSAVVIVGVDTHKHIHVAVAIDALGVRLAARSASADRTGYAALVDWARSLGTVEAFGIEGTARTVWDWRATYVGTRSASSK